MAVRDYLMPYVRKPNHYLPAPTVDAIKKSRKHYLETGERVLLDRTGRQKDHIYASYQIYMENISDNLKMHFIDAFSNQQVADVTRGMIFDGALLHLGCWLAGFPVGDTYDFNEELSIILSNFGSKPDVDHKNIKLI